MDLSSPMVPEVSFTTLSPSLKFQLVTIECSFLRCRVRFFLCLALHADMSHVHVPPSSKPLLTHSERSNGRRRLAEF